jgi:hypothetical protein
MIKAGFLVACLFGGAGGPVVRSPALLFPPPQLQGTRVLRGRQPTSGQCWPSPRLGRRWARAGEETGASLSAAPNDGVHVRVTCEKNANGDRGHLRQTRSPWRLPIRPPRGSAAPTSTVPPPEAVRARRRSRRGSALLRARRATRTPAVRRDRPRSIPARSRCRRYRQPVVFPEADLAPAGCTAAEGIRQPPEGSVLVSTPKPYTAARLFTGLPAVVPAAPQRQAGGRSHG